MSPSARAARTVRAVGRDTAPWAAIAAIALLVVEQRAPASNAQQTAVPEVVSVQLAQVNKTLDTILAKLDPLTQKVTGIDVRLNAIEQWRASQESP